MTTLAVDAYWRATEYRPRDGSASLWVGEWRIAIGDKTIREGFTPPYQTREEAQNSALELARVAAILPGWTEAEPKPIN